MNYRQLFISLFLLLVCSWPAHSDPAAPTEAIYIVDHGWHTGIVVPASAAERAMPFLPLRFVQPYFYEFGWGDETFYQAEQIGIGMVLKAILVPTDSVVHVVAVTDKPQRYFPHSEVIELGVTMQQLDRLLRFIASAYVYTPEGVVTMETGRYGDSQFYRSDETYHLFNTCNTWTARALDVMGLAINPGFVFTSGQLMSWLRRNR